MDLIDYRKLASAYDFREHASKADAYFQNVTIDSLIARKPFANPTEASVICSGLSVLLPELQLFAGAKVLDFGAGTCWLSRILALLGCEVYAVDVSEKALGVGERLIKCDPVTSNMPVHYVVLRDSELPFSDGYFDRVVCFDAFHHVPDQCFAIREICRVLCDGGIAAFHEAGPRHSQHPQSQYEMRMHGVIEGDIDVQQLAQIARSTGVTQVRCAAFSNTASISDVLSLERFASGESVEAIEADLVARARTSLDNLRVFCLHKGDPLGHLDSRGSTGLGCELTLEFRQLERSVLVTGMARNVGRACWLPALSGVVGAVNIGVHLQDEQGRVLDHDYARAPLSDQEVAAGEVVPVDFEIPLPEVARCTLTVDLVSEGVAWFELAGSKPVSFTLRRDGASRVSETGTSA